MENTVVRLETVALADCKTNEEKIEVALQPVVSPISQDTYKGWKEYSCAGGKFVVKYPTEKLVTQEPTNRDFPNASGCIFNIGIATLMIVWAPLEKSPSDIINEFVSNEMATKTVQELSDVNVNGFTGKDIKSTSEAYGDQRNRVLIVGDYLLTVGGVTKHSEFSAAKEDIEKFINSFALAKIATVAS